MNIPLEVAQERQAAAQALADGLSSAIAAAKTAGATTVEIADEDQAFDDAARAFLVKALATPAAGK